MSETYGSLIPAIKYLSLIWYLTSSYVLHFASSKSLYPGTKLERLINSFEQYYVVCTSYQLLLYWYSDPSYYGRLGTDPCRTITVRQLIPDFVMTIDCWVWLYKFKRRFQSGIIGMHKVPFSYILSQLSNFVTFRFKICVFNNQFFDFFANYSSHFVITLALQHA